MTRKGQTKFTRYRLRTDPPGTVRRCALARRILVERYLNRAYGPGTWVLLP